MWATASWRAIANGTSACWEVARDRKDTKQPTARYFEDVTALTHCGENWNEGNRGLLGLPHRPPVFAAAAPLLLGFHEDIDAHCAAELNQVRRAH